MWIKVMGETGRLDKQIAFIIEIDKLKNIYRQSFVTGTEKAENDAEHSWHLALMGILLQEYVPKGAGADLDLLRVLKMVLVHDLVEIDAGDTYCYDEDAARDKRQREEKAASRLFNLLPADQATEFRSLWDEFEGRTTPEALFAAALDRLQPVLLNYQTKGRSWREHGITADQVLRRNELIREGAPALWAYVQKIISEAVEKGYLLP
jgi:putative hydrolase of HD superfamily